MAIPFAGIDFARAAIIGIEIAAILSLGFVAGKALHGLFTGTMRSVAKKTKTELDNIMLEYLEKPVELVLIVSLLYAVSGLVENLSFINRTINLYLYSILILLGAYLLSEIVGALLKWAYVSNRARAVDITLLPFARKLSKILILLFGLTIALSSIGIDITGILAITSVVGIIVGLAAQETLANIFAGLALQIDRPYVYNEYLRLASGEVFRLKKIGVRSSKLEDSDGNVMAMTNSEFSKQRITNLSKRPSGYAGSALIEFPVGVKAAQAIGILSRKLEGCKKAGTVGQKFDVWAEKAGKDSFTLGAAFECKNYSDIATVRRELNLAALEYAQKSGKEK